MDFDRIDPDDRDVDAVGSDDEDEQQPLISPSSAGEEHISLVTRHTTTSQKYGERGKGTTAEISFITGVDSCNVIRERSGPRTEREIRIGNASDRLKELYPKFGERGFLTLGTVTRKNGAAKVHVSGP